MQEFTIAKVLKCINKVKGIYLIRNTMGHTHVIQWNVNSEEYERVKYYGVD